MSPSLPLCGHPACAGTARCLRHRSGTGHRAWGVPSPGPQDEPPADIGPAEARAMLAGSVSGIDLGDYDRYVLALVSASDDPVLATVASLISRSGARRLAQQREAHLSELARILDVLEDERIMAPGRSPATEALVERLRHLLGRQTVGG